MKKLLVVLLALTFVVAMATAASAVVTSSVDGKVEWTYTNGAQFGGEVKGAIIFDLGKDFGEGYSAGLKIKIDPTNDNNSDELKFDGDGWIKMVKDFGTLTFQPSGMGGNAANELGVGFDMSGNAGVKFESTTLVEGLALTAVLNDNRIQDKDLLGKVIADYGDFYNYLLKAVYTADALTLGAGYQMHTQPEPKVATTTAKDAMAVWAGYKIGDSLNLGLEYASRPNLDGFDPAAGGSTGIRVKADYTVGALTINGKVQVQTGNFYNMDPDDVGTLSAWNFFQYGGDVNLSQNTVTLVYATEHADPEDGCGIIGTAVKIDATYKLTDALSLTATVEDIMTGAKYGATTYKANNLTYTSIAAGTDVDAKLLMSYKLGVTDKLTEKLTLDGWYAGYGDLSEIGVKASYAFVAGLDGSLEVKSNSVVGSDAVNTYTAKIVATL